MKKLSLYSHEHTKDILILYFDGGVVEIGSQQKSFLQIVSELVC